MALNSINTNIAAMFAQTNISKANTSASSSIARLSSGSRIVQAADDVSGLSVGTALRTTVTTLKQALVNSSQGTSMLQVADGAMSQIIDILQRQKSIAVQAASGSLTDSERAYLDQEFQNLTSEIDRIAESTSFNGVNLVGGGLGTTSTLVQLDATAANFNPGGASNTPAVGATSIVAIQAYNKTTGAELDGNAAAGEIQFVTSDGTTALADGGFNTVSSAIVGEFESFDITNVAYGVAATLEVTIGGQTFTGTFADGDTNVVVDNGSTFIDLGVTALDLTDEATTAVSRAQVADDFINTVVTRLNVVEGVDFTGTRLEGAVGNNFGPAAIRSASADVAISNFRYLGDAGAANTAIIGVTVNGETWIASGVPDAIAAGNTIAFESQSGVEALVIDLTSLTTAFTATINPRLDEDSRAQFLAALNTGFSAAGGGVNFNVGAETTDTISVSLGNASSSSLYRGQNLSVATAPGATSASTALDAAIVEATAIRAEIGALQSRFSFAAATLETSIQNQDAARGLFLDTDVSAEATAFATAQVQLQAGIAVLAQANLLPQQLLKLIG